MMGGRYRVVRCFIVGFIVFFGCGVETNENGYFSSFLAQTRIRVSGCYTTVPLLPSPRRTSPAHDRSIHYHFSFVGNLLVAISLSLLPTTASTMQGMGSSGASKKWNAQKKNALRVFEKMRVDPKLALGHKLPKPWDELTESTLCEKEVYMLFAEYVTDVYIIESGKFAGKHYSCDSALNTLSILINLAKDRFEPTGNADVKLFFTCLDPKANTGPAQWLRGTRKEMVRTIFARSAEAGEQMDNSAIPLYACHVKVMQGVLARMGTAEAAKRKLTILTAWSDSGRSAETSFLVVENLKWDPHFSSVVAEIPQTKTSKVKLVLFLAGQHRHLDWPMAFGDDLVMNRRYCHEDDEPGWLFPQLQNMTSPGEVIGGYVKSLVPLTSDLPPDANAGGFRPGVCNTLIACMPAEIAVGTTGHDVKHTSALWNYVDAKIAIAMVGALVLHGWPPLPYGQTGKGPVPASIFAVPMIDPVALNVTVDTLFKLDSSSPQCLLQGGTLRPLVISAFSSIVMYYPLRVSMGEMRPVNVALKDAWIKGFGDIDEGEVVGSNRAHRTLLEWSNVISAEFASDNFHLTPH